MSAYVYLCVCVCVKTESTREREKHRCTIQHHFIMYFDTLHYLCVHARSVLRIALALFYQPRNHPHSLPLCRYLSVSLSLSCTRTRARVFSRTRALIVPLSFSLSLSISLCLYLPHADTHTYSRRHSQTNPHLFGLAQRPPCQEGGEGLRIALRPQICLGGNVGALLLPLLEVHCVCKQLKVLPEIPLQLSIEVSLNLDIIVLYQHHVYSLFSVMSS